MRYQYYLGLSIIIFSLSFNVLGSVLPKVINETLELAAKRSGTTLSPATKKVLTKNLQNAIKVYGDDILKTVKIGGLEAIKQGEKHGDEFWKLCRQNPQAARVLALNADELIPLTSRYGKSILVIEAKTPGLSAKILQEFGTEGLESLSKASASDLSKLAGLGAKTAAEDKQLLLNCYQKSANKSKFLNSFSWKQVMQGGVTASMIIATYKISDGVEESLKIVAKDSLETFRDILLDMGRPIRYGLYALILILLYPLIKIILKIGNKIKTTRK